QGFPAEAPGRLQSSFAQPFAAPEADPASSAGFRQRRPGQRYRIAAEGQQAVERAAELHAKAVEAWVRDRHEAFYLDQVEGAAGMLVRRKEGADQPERREDTKDPTATDVRRRFGRQQRAIPAGFLLRAAPDRERIGAIAAGVAASTER